MVQAVFMSPMEALEIPSHNSSFVIRHSSFVRGITNHQSPIRKGGFTLLEVLLTIILMVTGFVLLLQALATGLFSGGENETELIAINLAQEKMEAIRNDNYSNIVNEAKAAVPGFTVFQREVVVTIPQAGLKQAVVNVYWFTKADELNVSLVTYVSDI